MTVRYAVLVSTAYGEISSPEICGLMNEPVQSMDYPFCCSVETARMHFPEGFLQCVLSALLLHTWSISSQFFMPVGVPAPFSFLLTCMLLSTNASLSWILSDKCGIITTKKGSLICYSRHAAKKNTAISSPYFLHYVLPPVCCRQTFTPTPPPPYFQSWVGDILLWIPYIYSKNETGRNFCMFSWKWYM